MEKSKRLLTLVAIVAVITISGVALAINGNLRFLSPNLDLVQDFSDIVESPRQMTYPFTLTDLPEYFNASVIIEGSGYTGQPHTVYVLINHTRPDSSVWLATGNYSLTIENGVITENITSGSFSDLRNTEPFVSPGHSWTPVIPADTYDIVLSLNAIQWTSIVEYTINAIAGTGGTIDPSGQFVVPEGAHQEFTITADTGYVISDILIDGESLIGFQPYTQDVGLGPISSDRTIEATFMPASAAMGDITVTGAEKVSSFITLTATGTSAAAWDTSTVPTGRDGSAVKLSAAAGSTDYAAIVLDTNLLFSDVDEFVLNYWIQDTSLGGVHISYYLTDGTYNAEIAFYQPIAYIADTWTEMVFDATADPTDSGYYYWGNAPELDSEIKGVGWPGAPASLPALSYWQALIGAYTVDRIQVEYGWYDAGTADAWIDDISLNGDVFPMTENGANKGDTLTVSGDGVTSGRVVNVYWDYVTTAGLMNSIAANPDGSYSVELDVPSDVGGDHYIWVEDVGTGETKMYPTAIFVIPKLSLSPSSGLVGDEITVNGYGYQANTEISFTFDGTALTTTPTTVETNADGYFTATFDVPDKIPNLYTVVARDNLGWIDAVDFTVVP